MNVAKKILRWMVHSLSLPLFGVEIPILIQNHVMEIFFRVLPTSETNIVIGNNILTDADPLGKQNK